MDFANFPIKFRTKDKVEFHDITDRVKKTVEESGIKNGFVNVFAQHTTIGLWINEYEEGVITDLKAKLDQFAPNNGKYLHNGTSIYPNGSSHIRNTLFKPNLTIPIIDGKLSLGTYQSIIFVELDGPREERNLMVQVIGTK